MQGGGQDMSAVSVIKCISVIGTGDIEKAQGIRSLDLLTFLFLLSSSVFSRIRIYSSLCLRTSTT